MGTPLGQTCAARVPYRVLRRCGVYPRLAWPGAAGDARAPAPNPACLPPLPPPQIFKKLCRKFGVERWPYRRLKAVGLAADAPTASHIQAAHAALPTASAAQQGPQPAPALAPAPAAAPMDLSAMENDSAEDAAEASSWLAAAQPCGASCDALCCLVEAARKAAGAPGTAAGTCASCGAGCCQQPPAAAAGARQPQCPNAHVQALARRASEGIACDQTALHVLILLTGELERRRAAAVAAADSTRAAAVAGLADALALRLQARAAAAPRLINTQASCGASEHSPATLSPHGSGHSLSYTRLAAATPTAQPEGAPEFSGAHLAAAAAYRPPHGSAFTSYHSASEPEPASPAAGGSQGARPHTGPFRPLKPAPRRALTPGLVALAFGPQPQPEGPLPPTLALARMEHLRSHLRSPLPPAFAALPTKRAELLPPAAARSLGWA